MDKIMVELWIPAAELSYDVLIPRGSQLSTVQKLLVAAVSDLTAGKYQPQEDAAICDRSGNILNIDMTVEELKLENGSKLMLI